MLDSFGENNFLSRQLISITIGWNENKNRFGEERNGIRGFVRKVTFVGEACAIKLESDTFFAL